MKSEDPEWAAQFQVELKRGECFPSWSFDDLQEVLPDVLLRKQMIAEIRPRGLGFFTEPIPVFDGWPDAMYHSLALRKAAAMHRQAGDP
jgi:hypothetical protein